MKKLVFLVVCGVLAMAMPAYANSSQKAEAVDEKTAERIESAYQRTARGARLMGKKRLHYQNRVKRLDNVLERLEAGEDVDPREINALIR